MSLPRYFLWMFHGFPMGLLWIFIPAAFRTLNIIFCLIHLLLLQVAVAIAVDIHKLQQVFRIANTGIPVTY